MGEGRAIEWRSMHSMVNQVSLQVQRRKQKRIKFRCPKWTLLILAEYTMLSSIVLGFYRYFILAVSVSVVFVFT